MTAARSRAVEPAATPASTPRRGILFSRTWHPKDPRLQRTIVGTHREGHASGVVSIVIREPEECRTVSRHQIFADRIPAMREAIQAARERRFGPVTDLRPTASRLHHAIWVAPCGLGSRPGRAAIFISCRTEDGERAGLMVIDHAEFAALERALEWLEETST